MNKKQSLRQQVSHQIESLGGEERIVLDAQIATHVTHLGFWKEAEVVLGYMALADEVDVQAVLRVAVRSGKTIGLPRIATPGGAMEFRSAGDYPASLERHAYGFLQPPDTAAPVDLSLPTLVLVPGRVFDRRGHRVGRGGGYYDRFLPTLPDSAVTVGVGYSVQLIPEVPADENDIPLQMMITDRESCFFRRPGNSIN